MNAIVCVSQNWGIGRDGQLLFHISADLRRFRIFTTGKTVILGHKTLLTFPHERPLPRRRNIVLTRRDLVIEGAEVAHSTAEALTLAEKYPRTLVIGGASIYRQFLPFVDTVHITKIDLAPASDSYFENLDASPDWQIADAGEWQEENGLRYRFMTYKRV